MIRLAVRGSLLDSKNLESSCSQTYISAWFMNRRGWTELGRSKQKKCAYSWFTYQSYLLLTFYMCKLKFFFQKARHFRRILDLWFWSIFCMLQTIFSRPNGTKIKTVTIFMGLNLRLTVLYWDTKTKAQQ